MSAAVLIRSLEALPDRLRGGAVAIGNFDGVHRGHQAVLLAARVPDRPDAPRLALTFEPHPRAFFSGEPLFRLSPEHEKAELLHRAGLDATVSLPFDAEQASETADAFVERVLVAGLGAKLVSVGFDFRFGARRAGDADTLLRLGPIHGFDVAVVEPQADGGEPVSSSRIREALGHGDIAEANRLLGHPWMVSGTVIKGQQLGRTLGYPTANIALAPEAGLAHGIYAVRVETAGRSHDGVASFGRRPTFDNGAVLLEAFLFDFSGDLYGQEIDITFHAYLRGEERFESAEALVVQMDRDSENARNALAGV